MDPKAYLDRYTYLKFTSPLNSQVYDTPVTGYGSGWGGRWQTNSGNGSEPNRGPECQREYALLRDAMRVAHHGNANTPCGPNFMFSETPLGDIAPHEEFYSKGFIQVFCGKGSPDEMIDTLRIAHAVGRIGLGRDLNGKAAAKATPAEYVKYFFTLDCNGLVGNFYGGNPSASIDAYCVPGRRRRTAAEVQLGDCIVTHSSTAHYEHIGLVAGWQMNGDSNVTLKVAEWGWYGAETAHYREHTVPIVQGPDKRYGVGWKSKSNKDGKDSFRYIFAPPAGATPYGWS